MFSLMYGLTLIVVIVGTYRGMWNSGWWELRPLVDILLTSALVGGVAPITSQVYDHWTVSQVTAYFVLPWALAVAYYERKHRLLATT